MPDCPKGQILRVGYVTKKGVKVKPTCVKDRGLPGKGKKTLPDLRDDYHLSDYGYSTHKSASSRRESLRSASKDQGTLDVLRRLNLIRNKQATGSEAKNIMSEDVRYMQDFYKREQRGGNYSFQSSYSYSWSSNGDNDTFDVEKTVNGHKVRFQSVDNNGIQMLVDDELRGRLIYEPKGHLVTLCKYDVQKGYNTSFLNFMTKYFRNRGFKNVDMVIDAKGATEKLNFWIGKGFKVIRSDNEKIVLGANL